MGPHVGWGIRWGGGCVDGGTWGVGPSSLCYSLCLFSLLPFFVCFFVLFSDFFSYVEHGSCFSTVF